MTNYIAPPHLFKECGCKHVENRNILPFNRVNGIGFILIHGGMNYVCLNVFISVKDKKLYNKSKLAIAHELHV